MRQGGIGVRRDAGLVMVVVVADVINDRNLA